MEKSEESIPKGQVIEQWIDNCKLKFLVSIGEYAQLLVDTVRATLWRPPKLQLVLKQMYNIGVGSLAVVAITGFFTGLVLAAQSFYQLAGKGLSGITGLMVAKAMMTELGPVLTAFMVTGRVGAAMCAELGTMRVTEQIDALRTMAVNPNRYLVAPRLLAGVFMMPLLTLFSTAMGVFGGYLISTFFFGMAPSAYFDPIPVHISLFDFFSGSAKAFFFGVMIMTISCYKGMNTSGGAEGVGRTTTQSVVICYVAILFSNFFLTMSLNLVYPYLKRLIS